MGDWKGEDFQGLDYYEVVLRSGVSGIQSEDSHLPQNRDNSSTPLSTSVPTLCVSATSLCDSHPCRRFGAPTTLPAIWHLSASSPLRRHLRPSISSTTSSQCAIVKLFSRKKHAVSLARMIYRSRVARNRDKNSTALETNESSRYVLAARDLGLL